MAAAFPRVYDWDEPALWYNGENLLSLDGVPVGDVHDPDALEAELLDVKLEHTFVFAAPDVAYVTTTAGLSSSQYFCKCFLQNMATALERNAVDMRYTWSYATCTTTLQARFVLDRPQEEVITDLTKDIVSPMCESPSADLKVEKRTEARNLLMQKCLMTLNGWGVRAWGDRAVDLVADPALPKNFRFVAPFADWRPEKWHPMTDVMARAYLKRLGDSVHRVVVVDNVVQVGSVLSCDVMFTRSE